MASKKRCPSPTNSLRRSNKTLSRVAVDSVTNCFVSSVRFLIISFRYLTVEALSFNLAAASAAFKYTSDKRRIGKLFNRISPKLPIGNLLIKIRLSP